MVIQAVAAFGAGLTAQHTCSQAALPSCSKPAHGGTSFKLSVQVHAASIPELGQPGTISRIQPRVRACFGAVWKETEVADYVASSSQPSSSRKVVEAWACGMAASSGRKPDPRAALFTVSDDVCKPMPLTAFSEHNVHSPGPGCDTPRAAQDGTRNNDARSTPHAENSEECAVGPWRFGDTLTFSASVCDLRKGGLRLRLGAASGVQLGPWQVDMPRLQELGEAVLDVQRFVLPACAPVTPIVPRSSPRSPVRWEGDADAGAGRTIRIEGAGHGGSLKVGERPPWWETPVLVVPLTMVSDSPHSGAELSVVARLALSFSVNMDPEVLMREADAVERPLVETIERALDRFTRWMDEPVQPFASCSGGTACGAATIPDWDCVSAAQGRFGSSSVGRRPRTHQTSNELLAQARDAPEVKVPGTVDWAYRL